MISTWCYVCIIKRNQRYIKQTKQEPYKKTYPGLSPPLTASKMEDKFFSQQWFKENGYESYLPPHKHLDDYPYILKTSNGTSGKYVYVINNSEDLARIQFDKEKALSQAIILSPFEYAYHFFAIDGNVIKETTYQHDFSDIIPANTIYIRGEGCHNNLIKRFKLSNAHEALFKKIILQLNFTGFGCIDFKLIEDNLYILEINSRMGGSVAFYDDKMHDFLDFMKTAISYREHQAL
jgi:glutathione synthase/RimK-type ligase-like ATP-grasp enzyme